MSASRPCLRPVAATHDISPYAEDVWKITPKLTLNIGLRWDYFPPFHEVQDRWSFLNPNLVNPVTGNMGLLQFAGNHGGAGVSCGCRTPVNTWFKNYGPRLGLAYAVSPTTVVRAGYALVYSIGGGVGGRGGAGTGTGQTGFNTTAATPTEITSTSQGMPWPVLLPQHQHQSRLHAVRWPRLRSPRAPAAECSRPDPAHQLLRHHRFNRFRSRLRRSIPLRPRAGVQHVQRWHPAGSHQGHHPHRQLRRHTEPLPPRRWIQPARLLG